MDVLMIGTLAGVAGMLVVFVAGYYFLRDRIAPVEVQDESDKPSD